MKPSSQLAFIFAIPAFLIGCDAGKSQNNTANSGEMGKIATEKLTRVSNDLIVPANTVRTIGNDEDLIIVRNFRMGDNSQLVIPAALREFSLKAERAVFGRGAIIRGTGTPGLPGRSLPNTEKAQAGNCKTAAQGDPGGPGGAGGRGVDITIEVGITNTAGLTVIATGGDGGGGGDGTRAGQGGNGECQFRGKKRCDGQPGGGGGDAGPGGRGGHGGNIKFTYWWIGSAPEPGGADLIKLVSDGGRPGPSGSPGSGGPGGSQGESGCGAKGAGDGPAGSIPGPAGRGEPGTREVVRIPQNKYQQIVKSWGIH